MNDKRTNYIFTALFIISIIYTTIRLFSLQDDLILSSQVLDSSQIPTLSPVLFQLYIAVGITILTGVIVLAMSFKAGTGENLRASDTNDTLTGKSNISQEGNLDKSEITTDVGFIEDVLKSLKDKKDHFGAVLNTLCQRLELGQGAIYTPSESKGVKFVEFNVGYAFSIPDSDTVKFELGEGLVGQAAKEGELLMIEDIPDEYINIISGLGSASPNHLMILPIFKGKTLQAVVELASFTKFSEESIILIKESFNLLNKMSSSKAEINVETIETGIKDSKTKSTVGGKKKKKEDN